MHPMDMNWYFDHDELDALQQRAVYNADANEYPYGRETRWLELNDTLLQRALNCADYKVSYFNISLSDDIGTHIPKTHVVMSDSDFACINCNNKVENNELHYHCSPQNFDWVKFVNNKINAFLYCTVHVSTTGAVNRRYYIDLTLSLDDIQSMGKEEFKKFMDSFL